jgi:hypothetical protein
MGARQAGKTVAMSQRPKKQKKQKKQKGKPDFSLFFVF